MKSRAWMLSATLVLAWLIAFASLWLGGRYTEFLAPNLWPILAMAVVLLSLFLLGLLLSRRGGGGSMTQRWLQAGVLLLPLAYIVFVVPPEGLTSYAFATRSLELQSLISTGQQVDQPASAPVPPTAAEPTVTQAPAEAVAAPAEAPAAPLAPVAPIAPPAPQPIEAIEATPLELTQRAPTFRDQLIVTEGMVARPPQLPAGQFVLFRFTISCCVSDAMPVGLLVRYAGGDPLPEADAWVQLEGTLRIVKGTYGDQPVIEAARFKVTEAPANPYLNDMGNMGVW
jgi:uncharacterized repeat protein (TIGR03943 family)